MRFDLTSETSLDLCIRINFRLNPTLYTYSTIQPYAITRQHVKCMYAHKPPNDPPPCPHGPWSTLRKKWFFFSFSLKCPPLFYFPCHVATSAPYPPPPPSFLHHAFCTCNPPPFLYLLSHIWLGKSFGMWPFFFRMLVGHVFTFRRLPPRPTLLYKVADPFLTI